MLRFFAILIGMVACLLAAMASAAEDLSITTVLDDLQHPSGVAVRPETSGDQTEIYVADAMAGRVVRVRSGEPGAGADAITGFASQADGGEPLQSPGPRGLVFLDRTRVVVTGGDADGRGFVRLYEISDQPAPLAAEQHEQHLTTPVDVEQPAAVVTSFHGLARTLANDSVPDMLIVAAHGKQGSAGTWKVPIRAGTLGELASFASAEPFGDSTIPGGVAIGRHGYIIVSEPKPKNDSFANRLTFLNPIDGSLALQLTVELPQITSLAFSPRTGNLYASVFASDENAAGIYRIDDAGRPGEPACAAVRIAEVARPTALAFGPDGALYIAAMAESDDNETNTGVLLKLTGEL